MKAAFVLVVVGAFAAGFAGRRLSVGGAGASSTDAFATLARRVAATEAARASETAARSSQNDAARDERPNETEPRLDALESRVAAATKQARDDAASAAAADDVDPELVRLRGLADPALFEELRVLESTQWPSQEAQTAGLARTIAACDAFLARKLDVQRRVQVMTKKAVALRSSRDFDRAETTLREALALVDPVSDAGFDAGMQLAFNRSCQYDVRGAAERFLALSQLPGLSPSRRALCRYKAADFFLGPVTARDVARSRAEHQAVVDEFGASDDPMARHWAEESRKAIANLDHPDDAR